MEVLTDPKPEKKYKIFDETYPHCALTLAFAFLYPNRTNPLKRCIIITAIIAFNGAQLFWFTSYTFYCLFSLDIANFSRSMTLAVVLVLFFIKTYYVIYATNKFANLLDCMSRDLLKANKLSAGYQEIYDEHIRLGKIAEKLWLALPTFLSSQFPFYAGVCMSIDSIRTDDYKPMMVHEMVMIYLEDIQREPPFFHFYFAYNCIQCMVLVPCYCGFDGSFCIATTHLRMKLKLMIYKLQRAFQDAQNHSELKALVNEAARDHQDCLAFYNLVQDVYGPWLFAVFGLTSIMISFSLYQIYLMERLDPKVYMFAVDAVLHIFSPCYFASELTEVGDSIGSYIYQVPWELSNNQEVTKTLVFMIARAQKPLILTGWIVVFNMELFKSILQSSYSFFTLITA